MPVKMPLCPFCRTRGELHLPAEHPDFELSPQAVGGR
jgi:hypothetical protein